MNWISVKEQMPEMVPDDEGVPFSGFILGRDAQGRAATVRVFRGPWSGAKLWLCADTFFKSDEVTHWMPLPEPPKE